MFILKTSDYIGPVDVIQTQVTAQVTVKQYSTRLRVSFGVYHEATYTHNVGSFSCAETTLSRSA